MKIRTLVINAVIASLYVVVTSLLAFMSFGAIQFRVAEMLNHLAVFNKKYIIGIVGGVLISNLFFSTMVVYDLVFGVAHSLLSLLIMSGITRKITNVWIKMSINTLCFTLGSGLIAWELYLALQLPFWFSYFTVAIGELVVMGIGMPIMIYIDKKVHFNKQIEG
ncbi:QueT transporter family protein [Carnobacterium inhibens]|uniref:QueT transporter family protein n=1 Tax=Carnobacterium inhibens TaxID=147709 RepID=A0ABR7TDN2_9LACT|nr:QueT transporter family protein [Carnobacterium inhibens]MBC9826081.1 QueT transporter family protein [Carnobacterium inhibens]